MCIGPTVPAMPPLRFRAWHKNTKTMFHHVLAIEWDTDDPTRMHQVHTYPIRILPASEVALMQATGIKDRRGQEMYEGDVIEMEWSKADKGLYPVEWRDGGFEFYPATRFNPDGDVENIATVVGNIY